MDAVIIGRIAKETAIPESSVSATVGLFDKGASGPFIVRFRKELTGGLDETKVRLIQERMDYYREVRDKKAALLKSLSDQGKLTDEIRTRIENCLTRIELDDLHQRFRSKKKTRSSSAIEKGLEPLAEYFWNQEPDAWSVEEHLKVFVEASKELATPEQALQGVVDIIAEWIGNNFEYRRALREMLEQDGYVISNVVPAKVNQKTKYNMYYERRESVTTIPSHRVLAIRRGCKEGILISSIEGDHTKALEYLLSSVIRERESIFAPVLEAAVRESYSRILKPLIETEVRTELKERADLAAIRVFQENITNLLLSPPAGPVVVMGLDWGKDENCSVAVVSETGSFLEGERVRFTSPRKPRQKRKERASRGKEVTLPSAQDSQPDSETLPLATAVKITETNPSDVSGNTDSASSAVVAEIASEPTASATVTPDTDPTAAGSDTEPVPSETTQGAQVESTDSESVHPTENQTTVIDNVAESETLKADPSADSRNTDSTSAATQTEISAETSADEVSPDAAIMTSTTDQTATAVDEAPIHTEPKQESPAEKDSSEPAPSSTDSDSGAGDAEPVPPETKQDAPVKPIDYESPLATEVPAATTGDTAATDAIPKQETPVSANGPESDSPPEDQTGTGENSGSSLTSEETTVQTEASESEIPAPAPESTPDTDVPAKPESDLQDAVLTDKPTVEPLQTKAKEEGTPAQEDSEGNPESEFEAARIILKALITKHKVRALSIGTGPKARELETALRRIVTEENLGDILIAAVNDSGIAVYSSSRIAREEFPDWTPSARCAVSLARRLQDPLTELVKIDPKLIGVGQYQHDVDQKELHRKLLRAVQFCVNKVGVNVNTAGESLLRYVSGLNDKIARRITSYRKSKGAFTSRESIPTAVGMDPAIYEQAAGFLRVPDGDNALDRTAVHPESYPIVQKMASALEMDIGELIGKREKIFSLKLEDYATETAGIPTLKDIREELLKPGRDPRKSFKLPKFRADVTSMSDLKTGMTLEGIVTNVTNFGAFVDIGVKQDGLVHLSQMSNRFIRDPREAVKVGDIVQVKVISVETETKRIGLSMKALLPAIPRKRRKQQRHGAKRPQQNSKTEGSAAAASPDTSDKNTAAKSRSKPDRTRPNPARSRKKGVRKTEGADKSQQKKKSAPDTPEPSLQEKIAILQSKFRRIK